MANGMSPHKHTRSHVSVDRSYKSLSVAVLTSPSSYSRSRSGDNKKQRVLSAAAFVAFSVLLISVGLNRSDSTKVTIWASSIVAGTVEPAGRPLAEDKPNFALVCRHSWRVGSGHNGVCGQQRSPSQHNGASDRCRVAQTALLLLVVRDRPQEDAPAVKKCRTKQ